MRPRRPEAVGRVSPSAAGPISRDRLLLAAVLVAGLGVRLWLAIGNAGITMDSPLYVRMAEALTRAERSDGPAHHGYPALVALAGLVLPGRELPGRAVSFMMGSVLIALVFVLARRTLPGWAAGLAAALVALHPLLAVYSGPIMTETSFLALLFAGLVLLDRGRPLAGGACLGFGYVVRPEGLIAACGALLLRPGSGRRALRLAAGFLLVAAPYVGYLSWERGGFTLSPKTVLVRPPHATPGAAEWRVGDARAPVTEPPRTLIERARWAAPEAARHYLPKLTAHLARLLESWPWPLLVLSTLGLVLGAGPPAGLLLQLLVLPVLAVGPDPRFAMLFVPVLALYAAVGAARLAAWRPKPRGLTIALAVTVAVAAVAWTWRGPGGRRALRFDDGPMAELRDAGAWLRRNGRPGATVMDRKAYVPFFAGMRHTQLPDDDYETIMRYAQGSGADYLVLEEYVVATLRPQLLPLLADARFRAAEYRVRPLYHVRGRPGTGVVVMEIVRDSMPGPPR